MTNITKRLAELMTWDEKDLKKHLRKVGKQANLKLRDWYESDVWEKLPIEERKKIESWTKPNKGKYYVAPRNKTKRQLGMYIAHAERMLEYGENGETPVPNWLADMSDAFQKYYDPSDFWGVYYTEWASSKVSEEDYLNMADLWAQYEKVTDIDDFTYYLKNFPNMTPSDYEEIYEDDEEDEDDTLF